MRTEDIGYLLAVADAGSLVGAARGLGIGQPTLSKSIARLERALGTPLIKRLPRGIDLTDAGRAFVDRARPVMAARALFLNRVDRFPMTLQATPDVGET